ncbi:surface lipoprotein assembly modifier [Novosphingobium sp. KA1]|uniref:surface lipoprotein assembly modifier n=1 Tax=Novosphingobium sp. (strain KA1) TaxID=164608 RepID=UPI001F5D03B6|nr:surface lipoprotein assembly modifier [Novosphingobium sp. KA1]
MAGLATGACAQDPGDGAAAPADTGPAPAAGLATGPQAATGNFSAAQVFALADEARARGDFATAEAAYRALTQDPDLEIRTEARFRLAMMLGDQQRRYGDAALELRRILDDKPGAARVRLELARMQAQMGNLAAARRELRAASASGLPPEVEQLVRFYSRALTANKPFGGSVEFALAPDSNINRATRGDKLGTVIGDFTLDEDAQARSGLGVNLRGQGYVRLGLTRGAELMTRLSTSATLYRQSRFDDISLALQSGPQFTSGRDLVTLSAGPTWRWYGLDPYSLGLGGTAAIQHPMGKRGQLRVEGGASHVDNRRNPLQTGWDYTLSASLDRAFSARLGGGLQVYGFREAVRDPGYSLASGGVSAYLFRELGRTTLVGTLGYSRLEADERLFLYPKRRMEDRYSASIAATLRALHVGTFAPLVRLRWERNRSTIEIYDYRRVAAEFGITSAF